MSDHFKIFPVGTIRKRDDKATIEIRKEYKAALLGLDKFSHIIVFSWLHKNDTPGKRNILRVHPRGDRAEPLRGVFATRSPVRPNLIAISTCRILSVEENIIHIDKIDAFNETPVIDIKPCMSRNDFDSDLEVS
jgi:tRNA-Thr(GGU) m(6)t(6)A37 methyltransferase TsaA